MAIFNVINEYILSYVLRFLMGIFNNNFAVAIFMFTLVINLCMIPLSIKSQKSSMQQIRIKPKMDAIKEKYGDDLNCEIYVVNPTAGSHCGPDTVGISFHAIHR